MLYNLLRYCPLGLEITFCDKARLNYTLHKICKIELSEIYLGNQHMYLKFICECEDQIKSHALSKPGSIQHFQKTITLN